MMKNFLLLLLLILFTSCKTDQSLKPKPFSTVEIEMVIQDSLLNVRALEINEERVVFATSSGKLYSKKIGNTHSFKESDYFKFTEDSLLPNNFRAVAFQADKAFALAIESPAKLFKDGKLVYYENHNKAFYDAMAFWNDQEGIAIGDPTDSCMSIVITRDGGNSWKKLSCDTLPTAVEGEAAFAASNTNIAIVGNHTWIATGGKASRILYSPDKGKTWQVYNTPIVQGLETTGMYAVDFYDEQFGFAIGGDYTKPNDTTANKIRTFDGGKTWKIVAENQQPGYRSCIQFVPNSKGKALVAVGFKGVDYSNDFGETWQHLSDYGFYTIRFLNDSVAYAAGKGRVCKLLFKS